MHISHIQIRDPFILKHAGYYYMYGSTDKNIWYGPGTGFDVYKSTDLENWSGPIPAFRPPKGFWGTDNFWAPEVFEYNGAFYMFASFIGKGYNRGTAVLKSERPEGPFLPHSEGAVTPRDWMCLDGTLYIDENKQPWIVFCHEWVQIIDGAVCAARLSDDLKKNITEPITLFHSTDAYWSAEVYSPSNNVRGYVTDGCNMYRMKNGKLLLLWSCMGKQGYCIAYAISESGGIEGPWKQAEKPLFDKDGGHGMIFTSYDGRLMLSIHSPNDTPNERAVFLELRETDDGLEIV
ncbi:MAG: glycoside hydrolase family 43 protein [Acetivibrionales bacterium]|jgi:arabinan endo-1,5-alpha-L-arabinosidase